MSANPCSAGGTNERTEELGVNVRYQAEVTEIKGERGNIELTINGNEVIEADNVVLAIGLQGNLRKLGVEGDDWERVQYQLGDPDEYEDETIVVIGGGDAGLENALALASHNNVILVNRDHEFALAKDGNRNAIEQAIENEVIKCFFESSALSVKPGELTLKTKAGQEKVPCDRIIARIGAIPPRPFVESCGIEFPSEDRTALPDLTPQYESNVPGLYIIGALGGYPLIKQAMNQGYEVVEFILGNDLKPADEPLLEKKFGPLLDRFTVDEVISWFRQNVPVISGLTALQLRELMLDSSVHIKPPGETIFEIGDFGTTVYMIVEGSVNVHIDPNNPEITVPLDQGKFFGEVAMVSARPRTASISAATDCVLIEAPRRTMIKMMKSVRSMRVAIRDATMARQLRVYLSQDMSDELVDSLIETAERLEFEPGQPLFNTGDEADGVFIIKKGSVTLSRNMNGRDVLLGYTHAGHTVGEVAVVEGTSRQFTARAATRLNATWIEAQKFLDVMEEVPRFKQQIEERIVLRTVEEEVMAANQDAGNLMRFLVDHGMGEATDILLIDETKCIACDNCEKACAETHGGISRLVREAGPTFGTLHIPMACRHCEEPYCMADCPPDAIHRSPNGEVYIDDTCIGCGNCSSNCPYNAIKMSASKPEKPGLFSWLMFGLDSGPGEAAAQPDNGSAGQEAPKLARKCDSCLEIDGGPSCVRACPTGAAFRVSPDRYFRADVLVR